MPRGKGGCGRGGGGGGVFEPNDKWQEKSFQVPTTIKQWKIDY